MSADVFILKRRDFHPPPEVCRHPGISIYEGYQDHGKSELFIIPPRSSDNNSSSSLVI